MGYKPRYGAHDGTTLITPERLTAAIQEFVRADSEHGKRAQAIVAGLLDVFATPTRVESGRINDPSRKYSAGRLWIVLPARLPRFWLVTGVVSGAWVPA